MRQLLLLERRERLVEQAPRFGAVFGMAEGDQVRGELVALDGEPGALLPLEAKHDLDGLPVEGERLSGAAPEAQRLTEA